MRRITMPWNDDHDRFGTLVVLLFAVIVISGVGEHGWVRLIAAVLNLLALVVGFATTRSQSRLWTMTGLVVAGVVSLFLVSSFRVDETGGALGATVQVLVLGALTWAVLGRLMQHPRVSNQTMLGAVAAYLLLGQVFAWAYMALPGYVDGTVLSPTVDGEIPIYYSYVVLTTLGFGDVQPVGALAQRITVVEALIGQLFLAILLSRLVSLYTRDEAPVAAADHGADDRT